MVVIVSVILGSVDACFYSFAHAHVEFERQIVCCQTSLCFYLFALFLFFFFFYFLCFYIIIYSLIILLYLQAVMIPQGATEQLAVAHQESTMWTNLAFQLQGNGALKKHQKKTKVVQSAYCEVCKVDCNSNEVLDQHKLGKKHRKNMEKLQAAAAGPSASSVSCNLIIGPKEDPDKGKVGNGQKGQKGKRKAAAPAEDLETKRRKIVEGGAAAEAIRVCAICNVVCNSENVYNYHLTGRKHAAMLKKHGVRMVSAA